MSTRIRDYAPGVLVFCGMVCIGLAVVTWVSDVMENVNEYRRSVNAELNRIDSIQQNHAVAIQMLVDQARGHPLDGVAAMEMRHVD